MALKISCPNCGGRPCTEFWCAGEIPRDDDLTTTDPDRDYARVWLRENVAGLQAERWFHYAGCRRWMTITRDTRTNVIHDGA